jgi:hypothetical protein
MPSNNCNTSDQTCLINRIKSNNRAVELLETIEKAIDELYYDSSAKILYEDHEGNFYPADSDTRDEDFHNDMTKWIMKNCTWLVKDSMEQYTKIKTNQDEKAKCNNPY